MESFDRWATSARLIAGDFPMLGGIARQLSGSRNAEPGPLRPEDIDGIAQEIGRVLQQTCVPESTLPRSEILKSEAALAIILAIHGILEHHSKKCDARAGAMETLLAQSIMTPDNVEALLKMMNADIRSGMVRCAANSYLNALARHNSLWDVTLADGRLSSRLIVACAGSLDAEVCTENSNLHTPNDYCKCAEAVPNLLIRALTITKSNKSKILSDLRSYNWKDILERKVKYICDSHSTQGSQRYNGHVEKMMYMFAALHHLAFTVMQRNSRNASCAKEILRKLGESHELFHSVLKQIISGKFLTQEEISSGGTFIHSAMPFLHVFFHCLTPPPMGPETDALVRLARPYLERFRLLYELHFGTNDTMHEGMISMISATCSLFEDENWLKLKEESDQDRWERFPLHYVNGHEDALREIRKNARKDAKKLIDDRSKEHGYTTKQICANCFRLESDIGQNCTFKRCARCLQICYCSRACQVQHWHKMHKKVCKKKQN